MNNNTFDDGHKMARHSQLVEKAFTSHISEIVAEKLRQDRFLARVADEYDRQVARLDAFERRYY